MASPGIGHAVGAQHEFFARPFVKGAPLKSGKCRTIVRQTLFIILAAIALAAAILLPYILTAL